MLTAVVFAIVALAFLPLLPTVPRGAVLRPPTPDDDRDIEVPEIPVYPGSGDDAPPGDGS